MNRRLVLTGLLASISISAMASDDSWPDRALTIVVSSAPGGSADLAARVISRHMSSELKVPVVVVNKPGAAGQIANRFVASSKPDGYTLLLANNAMNAGAEVINADSNTIASESAFKGVGVISWLPSTLVVSKRLNVHSWADFKNLAQSKPEGLTYSTSNFGSAGHVSFLLLAQEYGIKLRPIPYNGGGPAIQAVAAEDVDATIGPIQPMEELAKAGRLVPILELAERPGKVFPDVPTARSVGVEKAIVTSWLALVAPAGIPEKQIARLRTTFDAVKADPQYTESIMRLGNPAEPGEYRVVELIKEEKARTMRVLKAPRTKE